MGAAPFLNFSLVPKISKDNSAVFFLQEKYNKKNELSLVDFYEAKNIEKQPQIDDLIEFQFYLSNKGLINDFTWDFEKLATQYIQKKYKQ